MQSRTAIASFVLVVVAACGGRSGADPLDYGYDGGSTGGTGGSSAADAKIDVAGLTCDEQTRLAFSRVDEAIKEAHKDLSCATNDDCMNVSISTTCSASCTSYVNIAGGKLVLAAIANINNTVCAGFDAKGCKIFPPPCLPEMSPACLNGVCTPFR